MGKMQCGNNTSSTLTGSNEIVDEHLLRLWGNWPEIKFHVLRRKGCIWYINRI